MKQKWQCAVDKAINLTKQERNKLERKFIVKYINILKTSKEQLANFLLL